MIIKSSRELYDFYVDWLAWAEGNSSKKKYGKYCGLCHNTTADNEYEMSHQFKSAGLDVAYPFGEIEYDERCEYRTQHLDTNRLAWVRARIADGVIDE